MGHSQNTTWPTAGSSDDVGIGTTNPFARFHISDGNSTTTGSSVLFEGEIGGTPTSGEGTRLMWIPEKAAFRVGRVSDFFIFDGQSYNLGEGEDFWDDNNIGEFSFATGFNNRATGLGSHALGAINKVDDDESFAIGFTNTISSISSFSVGIQNNLSANETYAFGKSNNISDNNSLALGFNNNLTSENSFSVGRANFLSNNNSFAIGRNLISSAENVVLFGRSNESISNVNTAFEFGIGDDNTQKNVLTMYKDGGVQFNELPGTGNALEIDNDGFISRTDNLGGLWTEESVTEIFYENDVTIGQTNTNRPTNTKLWINGTSHTNGLTINNPNTGVFLNDETQKITFNTFGNQSWMNFHGTNLNDNGGNGLMFNFLDGGSNLVNIMSLKYNGKVGIGTFEPDENLHVVGNGKFDGNLIIKNGDLVISNPNGLGNGLNQIRLKSDGIIRAREIEVDLQTIPDYVFADGYKLMSLEDLGKFVKINKHLPNVKSESDFEKEGSISLTEMNLILLEKVEELTLYILDLQTQINELKK